MLLCFIGTATTAIYTLSLHDALPIYASAFRRLVGERGQLRGIGEVALGNARGRDELCRLPIPQRSEEHTSELQSRRDLVCRLLLEKKKKWTTARLILIISPFLNNRIA